MSEQSAGVGLTRDEMAKRCALDIPDGAYVNLGIGIPERVGAHLPEGREVIFHSENGLLGMGPPAPAGMRQPSRRLTFVWRRPISSSVPPGGVVTSLPPT